MGKYIDKDALIAEIERFKKEEGWCQVGKDTADVYYARGFRFACERIINVLNTLEVKEVDFGTDVYKYIDEHFNVYDDGNQTLQTKDKKSLIGRVDVENIAKHFFELGLKVKQESNDEVKVGETQIYFNDSREQPYVGKGLDLSCMKYETLKTLFKDGDNVEILIRKA